MYTYNAKIESVYDGDTVTAIADLGFHIQIKLKCRLFGINAPELRRETREQGLLAKKRLEELVLGKSIMICTKKDKQEKYGRWLAVIYFTENYPIGKSVNEILIDEGFAVAYME